MNPNFASPVATARVRCLLWVLFAAVVPAAHPAARPGRTDPAQIEFFENKIRPILVQHCYECHSEESGKSKGELVLDTRDGIRAGGERGPAVVPRNVDESLLISAIRQEGRLRMPPPKHGDPLSEEVIADFEAWIKMGAPDPRDAAKIASTEPSKPEKPVDWEKERQFWAYQKPRASTPPAVKDAKWPQSDVDRFVLAKLEEKGLRPVADADRRTLARRVHYDLTGLPPTPAQVDAFVKDRSPDAYERLVDGLLASPHFGEQWGRHWLDVARYGESTGLDRNLNYPYAWRYRHWVIRAFNEDKPYDRFIHEQLAGDQLPAGDPAERDQLLTATGFLALGPKGLNETRPKYSKWQVVDDQVDVTTRGFLGLTVSCARCHDHKFDPIPTSDYHALAGIFASTDTLYGTVGGRGNRRPTSLLALAGAPELPVRFTREPTPNMFINTNQNFGAATTRTNRARGTNELARGGGRRQAATNQIERIPARDNYAMGVRDLEEPQDVPVYFRGDLKKPKDVVPRGFPRIVALANPPTIPEDASGRLQFAQWLTSPDNPLTARVAVNRAWQHLFGVGLVETPDNFGELGARPSHPELLDTLAVKFAGEFQWSVKRLVRHLVLSRTYQLGSAGDPRALEADPANTLLWRAAPRRLKAEALRDSLLAASGRLDPLPPETAVTAEFGDGYYGVNIWESDFPQDFRKRSVYLPIVRDMVPESLTLFDFPNPNLVGARREETTSPSQALFFMNNALVQEEALHLARRVLAQGGSRESAHVRELYRAAYQRDPSAAEVRRAREFVAEQAALLAQSDAAAVELPRLAPSDSAMVFDPPPGTGTDSATNAPGGSRPLGPGSASAVVVGKLAPGIAQPKLYRQAVAEKPATPEEGAWALLAQALFASAEFRYLQ